MAEQIEVMNMAYRSFYVYAQKDPDGNIRIYIDERPADGMPSEIVYPKQVNGVTMWQMGELKQNAKAEKEEIV